MSPGSVKVKGRAGRRRGGEATRRRILSVALRLFAREGFHGASVRAIARAAGLTEAAIYYHFPSKRAIVEALYQERGFLAALDELERLSGQKPLREQLVANALASARLWDENADFLRVVILEVLRGDKAADAVHRQLMERWRRGILELLSRYQARGDIPASRDLEEAASSWVYLLFGAFMERLLSLRRGTRPSRFLTPEFRRRMEEVAAAFASRLQSP
jgi:AcrR family transcriptional regulator